MSTYLTELWGLISVIDDDDEEYMTIIMMKTMTSMLNQVWPKHPEGCERGWGAWQCWRGEGCPPWKVSDVDDAYNNWNDSDNLSDYDCYWWQWVRVFLRFILLTSAIRLLGKANVTVLNTLATLQDDYIDSKAIQNISQIKNSTQMFASKVIKNIFSRYSRLKRMSKVVHSAERWFF